MRASQAFPIPSDGRIPVLRLISRLNIGGTAIHTILLTEGMRDSSYQVHLVSGREDPDEGNMLDYAAAHGVEPLIIPELGRSIHFWRDVAALWKIYRLIKRLRPWIVDTHAAKAGTLGRIAARAAGVPVVVHTFHGHVLRKYFGRPVSWVFTQVERLLARWTDLVIMVSRQGREELISFGVAPPERIEYVPLGLELEGLQAGRGDGGRMRAEWSIPPEGGLVGIVARLVPIKGHKDFISAAALVLEKRSDVWFAIVGDGELRGELEALVRERRLERHVIFTGFRHDLENVFAALDLLALTSHNEGLPVTIIEAMTAGIAVVATDVGGVAELVEEGVTGFLVPDAHPAAVADRILYLLDNPDLARRMGEEGKRRALRRFAKERLVRDMLQIYDFLLESRGLSPSPRESETAE
jgi:glycosyltransferase involved in cell wall biosynthesis